ncbi:MAG: ATP-binding protein, partial [bacterium]
MQTQLATQALDNLVTQFSSAMDCLRELIQNSMDAGSPQIEVWMEFLPGEDVLGTIAIHVDDFGVGMDEAVIDNELTQLFASSKEDDL